MFPPAVQACLQQGSESRSELVEDLNDNMHELVILQERLQHPSQETCSCGHIQDAQCRSVVSFWLLSTAAQNGCLEEQSAGKLGGLMTDPNQRNCWPDVVWEPQGTCRCIPAGDAAIGAAARHEAAGHSHARDGRRAVRGNQQSRATCARHRQSCCQEKQRQLDHLSHSKLRCKLLSGSGSRLSRGGMLRCEVCRQFLTRAVDKGKLTYSAVEAHLLAAAACRGP